MKIHALFVLKKGGVLIYYQEFTAGLLKIDPMLMSSFLTAMIDFSKSMVKEELNVIDFGKLRLFFSNSVKEDVMFILLTDISASVLLIQDRLNLVKKQFFDTVGTEVNQEISYKIVNNALSTRLNQIINLHDAYSESSLAPIIKIFTEQMTKSEFSGGALFSMKGEILYSNLPIDFLHLAIREVEIRSQVDIARVKSKLPKFMWQSGDALVCSQVIRSRRGEFFVVNLLFDGSRTNPGIADFELESIVKKINDVI
nr:hypothetical protein [Candidatus Sigynarchaeota archaeon]